MRFAPPRFTPPAELTWLFGAAFGPDLPTIEGDPGTASKLARQFDLGARIVARYGATRLEEQLESAAGEMIQAHRRAVAVGLAGDRTARRVARFAASRRLPIVFLKGFALQHLAPGPAGCRPQVDIDVLLSRRHAAELREVLVADGWAPASEPGNPQHLPPVQDPQGMPVDIHFRLRGIKVATERWATSDELIAAGLCQPLGLTEGAWIPQPPLLAAHLATHAIEQHGHRPATYPLLRVVADLIDLTATDDAAAARIGPLVAECLAEDELGALMALARILAQGRTPTAGEATERDAEALLRHIVAGTLDPAYRSGLAIDHTAGRLRQAHQDGALMRYIAHKLKSPGDLPDGDAGGPTTGLGHIRQRVLRLISLAARFTSAAAARLRRAFHR